MNRHCSSEIYQKWYSAVHEKAAASPLPIHHQWCIADKLGGSNKPSLRVWPHWWKQKTPPWPSQRTQPRLFRTAVSARLCTRELISTLLLLGGGVRPCTLTEKNKHTICLQTLAVPSRPPLDAGAGRCKSEGLFSQHAADAGLYSPLQTAPGFIRHGRWQIDRARCAFLGVLMQIFAVETQHCLFLASSFFSLLSKDLPKGFIRNVLIQISGSDLLFFGVLKYAIYNRIQ